MKTKSSWCLHDILPPFSCIFRNFHVAQMEPFHQITRSDDRDEFFSFRTQNLSFAIIIDFRLLVFRLLQTFIASINSYKFQNTVTACNIGIRKADLKSVKKRKCHVLLRELISVAFINFNAAQITRLSNEFDWTCASEGVVVVVDAFPVVLARGGAAEIPQTTASRGVTPS